MMPYGFNKLRIKSVNTVTVHVKSVSTSKTTNVADLYALRQHHEQNEIA